MRYSLAALIALSCSLSLAPIPALGQPQQVLQHSKACQAASLERSKLDTPALRDLLGKDPKQVVSAAVPAQIMSLRRLIELDEIIMFKCRLAAHPAFPGKVETTPTPPTPAVAAALASSTPPELPQRRPLRPADTRPKRKLILPLPVRKPMYESVGR